MTPEFQELFAGRRAVLVASTGGHLAQMVRLVPRLGLADAHFVTFRNSQSLSLVDGRFDVDWVPYVPPRGYPQMARGLGHARSLMARVRPDVVFSTGAGVAVPYLTMAHAYGIDAVYLESVSRVLGPSVSGRLLARHPGVHTFTQHPPLVDRRWRQGPSLLDEFSMITEPVDPDQGARVFVTLGTIRPFRFDRLVDRLECVVPPHWDIVWQLGCTERINLRGEVHSELTTQQFDEQVAKADVVVSHAGVGSALRVLELGKSPVLIPREPAHREHVDDHQAQIADYLSTRGLAVSATAPDLSMHDLLDARSRTVLMRANGAPSPDLEVL